VLQVFFQEQNPGIYFEYYIFQAQTETKKIDIQIGKQTFGTKWEEINPYYTSSSYEPILCHQMLCCCLKPVHSVIVESRQT